MAAKVEWLLPIGNLWNQSEFNSGNGSCGPAILSSAGMWSTNQRSPIAKSVVAQMQAWGLCSPTGVCNLPQLLQAAKNYKWPVSENQPNIGPMHFSVETLTGTNNRTPGVCVLEVSNGQALVDYLSQTGEDATNLEYHFIGLVGYNAGGYSNYLGCQVPQGFHAVDGACTPQNPLVPGAGRIHRFINTQLVYYSLSVLAAAKPYAVFAVTR
jgi:hypothetical protein